MCVPYDLVRMCRACTVRFPSETENAEDTRVHSITIESDSVSVNALKARIELLLGLPGKLKH